VTGWRKPSGSLANGACAGAASWRKATASMGHDEGNCVEAACGPGVVWVRDSKPGGDGTVLVVPAAAWRAFTARLRVS
jgi:uncharacterized protein DUF397